MSHVIYVYGTLRTGEGPLVPISGRMYAVSSWFPGIKLGGDSTFLAECREVTDYELEAFDVYEGYNEKYPETSLYIRRPYADGWIYEYNGDVSENDIIVSGDWFQHTKEKALG